MPPFSTSSTSHHTPCYRVYGINRKDSICYLASVNTPLSSPLPHQYEYDKQAFPKRQCTQALTTLTFTQSATSSFFIIWKQHIYKKGLPSALQPWLVVGTREGSSDSSWADSLWLASSVPPTSHCCKKIDEGTSKYRHKIYLPGGYTIPSPKLPQGQQMPAFILRLKI